MIAKLDKQIYRAATPEEKTRHKQIREKIQTELPDLKQRAKQKLTETLSHGDEIQHILALLKAERVKRGLSLSDLNQSTGIERSILAKLEDSEDANPTIKVLASYAHAVGKKVLVVLANADDAVT